MLMNIKIYLHTAAAQDESEIRTEGQRREGVGVTVKYGESEGAGRREETDNSSERYSRGRKREQQSDTK